MAGAPGLVHRQSPAASAPPATVASTTSAEGAAMSAPAMTTARVLAFAARRSNGETRRPRAPTRATPTSSSSSSSSSDGEVPRRAALLAPGVLAAASVSAPPIARAALDPTSSLTRRGMAKFVQNDVEGSIADFDLVVQSAPRMSPYMWQRGLSLYYAERYEDGAAQFRKDVAVNPNDTEEAIWAFLCDARDPNVGFRRADLMRVGPDPRRYMRAAYDLFDAGDAASDAALEDVASLGPVDEFYSLLYRGLWREARGDAVGARALIVEATQTQYANRSGDYMAALALVHCKRRGWAT